MSGSPLTSGTAKSAADPRGDHVSRWATQFEKAGMLGRIVALIVVLISMAWLSGYLVVDTTKNYVLDRELIDLKDESEIAEHRLEKSLSEIHARVLANLDLLAPLANSMDGPGGPESDRETFEEFYQQVFQAHSHYDEPILIKSNDLVMGDLNLSREEQELLPESLLVQIRDSLWASPHNRSAKTQINRAAAFWSGIRWRNVNSASSEENEAKLKTANTQGVRERFGDQRAFLTLVVPMSQPKDVLCALEVDVTEFFVTFMRNPRSFISIVNADETSVLFPFGSPQTQNTIFQSQFYDAIKEFKDDFDENAHKTGHGYLYPPRIDGEPQWVRFESIFDMGVDSPLFLESHELSTKTVAELAPDSSPFNKKFVQQPPPPGDPLRTVGVVNESVRRIRLRASGNDALELVKEQVQELVNEEITWTKVRNLGDLALYVRAIHGPGMPADKPIAYYIQATAREEISGAVSADLGSLVTWTSIITALLFLASIALAFYFTAPLRKMTSTASTIGTLDLNEAAGQKEIQELLKTLPTQRHDETGELARRFRDMLERILVSHNDLQKNQQELKQARDTLDMRVQLKTRELEQEAIKAQKANEAKTTFLATVSHDMRQPLHIIFTECELLTADRMSSHQHESVSLITKNARRLKYLINDILDYQRLIGGKIDLHPTEVNVSELLEDLHQHMQDAALDGDNQFELHSGFSGTIETDRPRLERILVNLLSNACKFTHGGKITLNARKVDDDSIEISVTDTGQGMSEKQQAELFEPLMASRTRGQDGTGLGLYICKRLAECMGGSIEFTSQLGLGTTFYLRLPKTALSPLANVSSSLRPKFEVSSADRSLLALVVDDETASQKVICDMLKSLGYQTIVASNGRQALSLASERRPDVITLDVIMDGMDGWQVLSKLKQNPYTEDIPVVMVTVVPDEEKGVVLGADGFVSKPIKPTSLTSAIMKSLQGNGEGHILVVEDDADCRHDVCRLLEESGWSVLEARNGVEALDVLKGEKVSLVLVDLYMPEMDGFALIEKIRDTPETQDLPVIVLSAANLSEPEQELLRSQVDHFFGKGGLDLSILNGEISRLMMRHQGNHRQEPTEGQSHTKKEEPWPTS